MPETLEKRRPHDLCLHVRRSGTGSCMSFMPLDARAQDNLLNDVRGLIAEYAQSVNVPLDPAVLADSGVEIVSAQTLQYIASLESLLEEAAADTDDDAFAERVERALR
ncbi:hypothetical protein [Aromatoleum aromaticum]|uniref:hypothetical protein n=1 Tax=Aromatoleum aromaticum TaxID=551760 RepID=UPI0012FF43FF|nr:hypothetical protein [Aromatoleum aromaticum]